MSREMRETHHNWLGPIPKDWQLRAVKNFYPNMTTGFTPPSKQEELYDPDGDVWVNISDLNGSYVSDSKKHINHDYAMSKHKNELTPQGSLMYAFKLSVGQVAFASCDLYTNEAIASFHPDKNIYLDFLKYSSSLIINNAEKNIYGANLLNQERIRNALIVYPPITEQQKIVHFLDRKCTAIDTAIEKTKKSIEKLEEYKKAVITKTVTKGIDPNAKMKDSGVEWIGEIPESWKIRRIKTVGTYRNGLTYSPDDLTDETNGTLVLRSSNIKDGKLVLQDNLYVRTHISDKLRVQKGDILICSRNGSRALIGKNALIDSDMDASFGAFMMIYRSKDPYYIHWVLKSEMMSYYLASFTTSTINQLIGSEFGNMYLPWPSNIQERLQISNYLNSKCSSIDALVTRKQETINKWEEYKKSLIYYAVTGKIDCRNEVIE